MWLELTTDMHPSITSLARYPLSLYHYIYLCILYTNEHNKITVKDCQNYLAALYIDKYSYDLCMAQTTGK